MNARKIMNASFKETVSRDFWLFLKTHKHSRKFSKCFFCVAEGALPVLRIIFNLTKINNFLGAFFMYVSGTFSRVNCTLYRVWYENNCVRACSSSPLNPCLTEGNLHVLNLDGNLFNKFPMAAVKNLQNLQTLSLGMSHQSVFAVSDFCTKIFLLSFLKELYLSPLFM
jgi:hypothetical protein